MDGVAPVTKKIRKEPEGCRGESLERLSEPLETLDRQECKTSSTSPRLCKEASIPYYTLPREIVKEVLSFFTSPIDFVLLRRVCRQWNTLLGELFFKTLMVKREELLQVIQICDFTSDRMIPFRFTRDRLDISTGTKGLDCCACMDRVMETTMVDRSVVYAFDMERG
jgi:hypothetical protein